MEKKINCAVMPDTVGNISAEYYYYHNGMRNLRKVIQVL